MVFSDDVMRTCSKHGMNCYVYKKQSFSEKKKLNTFGGKAYKEKTDIRMYYTIEALKLGFNVYMSDVDEHFFNNPLPYFLSKTVNGSQWDFAGASQTPPMMNMGISLYRATPPTIQLLECAINKAEKKKDLLDQWALADCQKSMKSTLKVYQKLIKDEIFFGNGFCQRFGYFSNNCTSCYVLHTVYCGRTPSKKAVLKESLLWNVDTDRYYSSTDRKYLQVAWFGSKSREEVKSQFQAALSLSKALNRTLIAPMFQCKTKGGQTADCALYRWTGVVHNFPVNLYDGLREHKFLLHPLVPKSVSQSTTNIFYVLDDMGARYHALQQVDMFKHFQISCHGTISCQKHLFAIDNKVMKGKDDVINEIKNMKESVMRVLDPKSFEKYISSVTVDGKKTIITLET